MVNWIRGKIRSSSAPIWLAIGVLAIATVIALPNYITGQWAWSQDPTLGPVKALRIIRQQGISLTGWHELEQHTIDLGHKKWSIQAFTLGEIKDDEDSANAAAPPSPSIMETLASYELSDVETDVMARLQNEPIFLFLRPQSDVKDEPLVEWIDLNGMQRWNTDQVKSVRFTMPPSSDSLTHASAQVTTRYFRGWNEDHTYAVMQWYAWPTGGSDKISGWFWADQLMQWQTHQRMPWVGVTLMLPMKPLGDIAPSQPVVEAIAKSIQDTLVQNMTSISDTSR